MSEPLAGQCQAIRGRRDRCRMGRALAALLLPALLGACGVFSDGSEAPPQKEPAKLDIAIRADADLNLDVKGRGAPMLLRVYELKSEVAFQEADFFALQKTDKAALGSDLLAVDQFIIRPGETRKIVRRSHPATTAIGFFAGYRDLPNAVWRVVHALPPAREKRWYGMLIPANKARLEVDLQKNAIVLTDLETGQRPVRYANESIKELEAAPSIEVELPSGNPVSGGSAPQAGVKMPTAPSAEILKALPKP